jgi:hypothetical protein
MATFIDGIAASENIDSSGERISIKGMDISSLAVDGVFTYEHEAATGPKGEKITIKMPEQTVGKILKANKIFSAKDCEDDRQKYFWDKCKTPFIYIMGELFDDYTDAARDLAGKFRYDQDRLSQNDRTVMNFSIEGAYIAKEGIEVTRSVARKCTITVLPCNKAARAEMMPEAKAAKGKNSIDSLFKTEFIEIELFKAEELKSFPMPVASDMQKHADVLGIEPMKKAQVLPMKRPAPMAAQPAAPMTGGPGVPVVNPPMPAIGAPPMLASPTNNPGTLMGKTKTGKSVMTHARIHEYHGFDSQDHQDAANMHHGAAQAAITPESGRHHLDKMKLHLQAARTSEQKETRFSRGMVQAKAASLANFRMNKAETAGSGMAAPSQLTGTAALAKEDMKGHWLKRAEEDYNNWDKKESYRAFMKKRMPHLADGEIDAIGKAIALKKSVDAESSLTKLVKKK